MCDCCATCKHLRFLGKYRLYPYRCRKEKSGITHSREWLYDAILKGFKCDKFEWNNFNTISEERSE